MRAAPPTTCRCSPHSNGADQVSQVFDKRSQIQLSQRPFVTKSVYSANTQGPLCAAPRPPASSRTRTPLPQPSPPSLPHRTVSVETRLVHTDPVGSIAWRTRKQGAPGPHSLAARNASPLRIRTPPLNGRRDVYISTASRNRRMVPRTVAAPPVLSAYAPPAIVFLQLEHFQMPTTTRDTESCEEAHARRRISSKHREDRPAEHYAPHLQRPRRPPAAPRCAAAGPAPSRGLPRRPALARRRPPPRPPPSSNAGVGPATKPGAERNSPCRRRRS